MLDSTVFCEMLVALVALCHLFEISKKINAHDKITPKMGVALG